MSIGLYGRDFVPSITSGADPEDARLRAPTTTTVMKTVVVMLDASLPRNADGTVDHKYENAVVSL
jgi:hypothetical protein